LNELVTRYGDLTEFWLDGAGSAGHVYDFDHTSITRVYQPNAMVFADAALLKYGDIRGLATRQGTRRRTIGMYWICTDTRYRPAEADTR